MIKGCFVKNATALQEQYERRENYLKANVDADKIRSILEDFINMQEGLMFFILELPTNADEEDKNQSGEVNTYHRDVYYIDGCSKEGLLEILQLIGDLLINDGLSHFGFGCHDYPDEIMSTDYNMVLIYSKNNLNKYNNFFEQHDITRTDKLITAWDTFSEENPGICRSYVKDGKNVYSIPEDFKEWGIYFAERREE